MAWRAKGGRQGFTLLEALVGMSVMGFFFLSLPGVLVVLERLDGENSARARTLLCAQDKMEELRHRAMEGGIATGEGAEVLGAGGEGRMERRWEIGRSALGFPLLHVRAECSCAWNGRTVRTALETLMMQEP